MDQVQLIIVLISLMCTCDREYSRLLFVLGSVILFIVSGLHYATAGILLRFVDALLNPIFTSIFSGNILQQYPEAIKSQYYPIITYIFVCGAFQTLTNFILFCTGNQRKLVMILVILLILEFGLNFGVAVYTSIQTTYLSETLAPGLKRSPEDLKELETYFPDLFSVYNWTYYTYRIIFAEAIVTFVVVLPIIFAQICLALNQNLRERESEREMANNRPMQTVPPKSAERIM